MKDSPTAKPRFAIKHDNGTYFVSRTAIGPMFGGRLNGKNMSRAERYDTRDEAQRVIDTGGWKFSGASVVEVKP